MKKNKKLMPAFILSQIAIIAFLSSIVLYISSSNYTYSATEEYINIPATRQDIITNVTQFKETSFNDDKLAGYGEELVKKTYNYFYKGNKKIGNHLSCENCHLNGGKQAYASPFIGLTKAYPTYIARENKIESLEDRINGCFERSMNGDAIDNNSLEMKAIIVYITKLSQNVLEEGRIQGQGFMNIKIPDRAANLKQGEIVYNA